jgi:hypothetical protein
VFKRRKNGSDDASPAGELEEQQAAEEATAADEPVAEPAPAGPGPHDVGSAPDDEVPRVDLGGLQLPVIDGMELHLEGPDEDSGAFSVATVVFGEHGSALQLMAVAAPRSGGFWAEVMDDLESEVAQAGGSLTRVDGRFGPELRGRVPAQDAQGNKGLQPARFVGAEGNRWFIRGMFMGNAAVDDGIGEFFEDIIAGCIVNRGERPMAPGDLIPLTAPEGLEEEEGDEQSEDGAGDYQDMEPFERGPEITEIR